MATMAGAGMANGEAASVDTAPGEVPAAAAPSPEAAAAVERFRHAVQLGMGQVVLATMGLPRYRDQTLGDLAHLFVAPLLRDRVAIARQKPKEPAQGSTDSAAQGATPAEEAVVGIALWASVSEAVDAKIAAQVKAKVFPIRLAAEDWTSGDTVWLLDLVAADRRQATLVLANFRQVAGDRPVKIAPLVAGLIEPEVAERLRESKPTIS